MSDSDVSLLTDDDVPDFEEVHNHARLASIWTDSMYEQMERDARRISSCIITGGSLSFDHQKSGEEFSLEAVKDADKRMERLKPINGGFQGENPDLFLSTNFQNAGMEELLGIRESLMNESLNHSKHLKTFVKENFANCISNMDTIGEVAARLHASSVEGGIGVHGATPEKVAEELKRVKLIAEDAFSGLIKRYKLSQNLDGVLQLLGKYDSLVILPSMVRSSVEARDFEAVVTLYQRAMHLVKVESSDSGEVHTIWNRLQTEVFKAMQSAVKVLQGLIHNSPSMDESFEAACYLEKLRRLNVPAASQVNSLRDFTECQVNRVIKEMKETKRNSYSSINEQLHGERHAPSSKTLELSHNRVSQASVSQERHCIQNLTLQFYEWSYEFWDLFKPGRNTQEPFVLLLDKGQEERNKVTQRVFSAYSEMIENCLIGICSSDQTIIESEEIVSFFTETCLELDEAMGSVIVPLYKDLVEHTCQQVILALESHLQSQAPNVFRVKNPCLHGFMPYQSISRLHCSIDRSMLCVSKLAKHASRIKVQMPLAAHPANNLLMVASKVCAESIIKIAARKPVLSAEGDEVDEFVLLVAWNVLEGIKTNVLPQVVTRWSAVLNSGGVTAKDNSQAFKWCCMQLEDAQEYVIKSWVEIKLEKLEPVMDSLLNMEHATEHSNITLIMAKPCIWELCTSLKAYDADMQHMILVLREEVMGEMYLAVVEGMQNLCMSDTFKNACLQAKCQLWLDVCAFHSWLINQVPEDAHTDVECVTLANTIATRIEEHVRSISDSAKEVKNEIKRIIDSDKFNLF